MKFQQKKMKILLKIQRKSFEFYFFRFFFQNNINKHMIDFVDIVVVVVEATIDFWNIGTKFEQQQ